MQAQGKENTRQPLDRFIPNSVRSCAFQLDQPSTELPCSNYEELLGRGILDEVHQQHNAKIMTFSNRQQNHLGKQQQAMESKIVKSNVNEQKMRKVNRKPYKVLDAPNLQDDFYLNLLAWSERNQIAVALDNSLYLWSGCSSSVTRMYTTSQAHDYLCSVSFCEQSTLALGNTQGQVKIFDMVKQKKTHNFQGHYGRVGSLDWCNGLLASGSRDGNVSIWDPRVGQVGFYRAHSQ
jgi:cell division cycle 20-like protein 1, cofactor of APC complex